MDADVHVCVPAIPSRMRITKLLSVVLATAEAARIATGAGGPSRPETCGNIPGSRRDGLFTSSSTGIVRVFGSIELPMRATAPWKDFTPERRGQC